jgi:hypothetical protein
VWAGRAEDAVAWLSGFRDAGATWAILLAAGGLERVELIAERVLPAFGAAG